MTRNFWFFILVTMFSYLGDVIAVLTIPYVLFKQTGSLEYASYFSILVLISCILVGPPSAYVLKRMHPLRLIMICDAIAGGLLIFLGQQEHLIQQSPSTFLAICFAVALVINFPMFAKFQLVHQYFIPHCDLTRLSMLQGKLYGLCFTAAAFSVTILFERYGFNTLMCFDALSYVPLIGLCYMYRSANVLGYDKKTGTLEPTGKNKSFATQEVLARRSAFSTYYLLNLSVYFFANFRSHLILTVLIAVLPLLPSQSVGIGVGLGTLVSIPFFSIVARWLGQSYRKGVFAAAIGTFALGLILKVSSGILAAVVFGFLLAEINSILLALLRTAQVHVMRWSTPSRLANIATTTGSAGAAVLLWCTARALEHESPIHVFSMMALAIVGVTGLTAFGVRQWVTRSTLARSGVALLAFAYLCAPVATSHADGAWTYRTVMLDRPRLIPELGVNSMSEDERFAISNIHCGLFKLDLDRGTLPDVVSTWSTDAKGLVYSFRIKKAIRDSDGRAVTAESIRKSFVESITQYVQRRSKFSKDKGSDLTTNPTTGPEPYLSIEGVKECVNNDCKLPGITALGDTLTIRLVRPQSDLPVLLAAQNFPIYSTKRTPSGETLPVSCGPYQVSSYTKDKMVLTRNRYYPNPVAGQADTFEVSFRNPKTAVEGFCKGEFMDLIFLVPTIADVTAGGCRSEDYLWKEVDTAGFWLIHMSSPSLLKDKKLFNHLASKLDVQEFKSVWKVPSRSQDSMIPYGYEQPKGSYLWPQSRKESDAPTGRKLTIRYIDGTPDPDGLKSALTTWMIRSGLNYEIVPTPFTTFMEDLSLGKSDIYIYAELATSKLQGFLLPFYDALVRHYSGRAKEELDQTWANYVNTGSSQALSALNTIMLSSSRFIPLYVFRRALVFRNGYYIRRHSTVGLASLPISEFRQGRPQ